MNESSKYYNWDKTLSYAADVSIVIASRGRGKTYGRRVGCIKDYIKNGYTFVEICRYKSELSPIMDGYFDKVCDEFPDFMFKTEAGKGYISPKTEDKKKVKWEVICYFIPLTDAQNAKKRTYKNVRSLIFDEAILERTDRFHRYVPGEYSKLANIVDTTTRERPDSKMRPHLYLLGNACDLLNPYFQFYGIDKMPDFGYSWYRNKSVIVHYEDPATYADDKLENTVSGRMTAGTAEGEIAARNQFITADQSMIAAKPKNADYGYGFICDGVKYGVWFDYKEGYIYINNKILDPELYTTFYLTRDDASANLLAANRACPAMQKLRESHYMNIIRYSAYATMNGFLDMLSKFGF